MGDYRNDNFNFGDIYGGEQNGFNESYDKSDSYEYKERIPNNKNSSISAQLLPFRGFNIFGKRREVNNSPNVSSAHGSTGSHSNNQAINNEPNPFHSQNFTGSRPFDESGLEHDPGRRKFKSNTYTFGTDRRDRLSNRSRSHGDWNTDPLSSPPTETKYTSDIDSPDTNISNLSDNHAVIENIDTFDMRDVYNDSAASENNFNSSWDSIRKRNAKSLPSDLGSQSSSPASSDSVRAISRTQKLAFKGMVLPRRRPGKPSNVNSASPLSVETSSTYSTHLQDSSPLSDPASQSSGNQDEAEFFNRSSIHDHISAKEHLPIVASSQTSERIPVPPCKGFLVHATVAMTDTPPDTPPPQTVSFSEVMAAAVNNAEAPSTSPIAVEEGVEPVTMAANVDSFTVNDVYDESKNSDFNMTQDSALRLGSGRSVAAQDTTPMSESVRSIARTQKLAFKGMNMPRKRTQTQQTPPDPEGGMASPPVPVSVPGPETTTPPRMSMHNRTKAASPPSFRVPISPSNALFGEQLSAEPQPPFTSPTTGQRSEIHSLFSSDADSSTQCPTSAMEPIISTPTGVLPPPIGLDHSDRSPPISICVPNEEGPPRDRGGSLSVSPSSQGSEYGIQNCNQGDGLEKVVPRALSKDHVTPEMRFPVLAGVDADDSRDRRASHDDKAAAFTGHPGDPRPRPSAHMAHLTRAEGVDQSHSISAEPDHLQSSPRSSKVDETSPASPAVGTHGSSPSPRKSSLRNEIENTKPVAEPSPLLAEIENIMQERTVRSQSTDMAAGRPTKFVSRYSMIAMGGQPIVMDEVGVESGTAGGRSRSVPHSSGSLASTSRYHTSGMYGIPSPGNDFADYETQTGESKTAHADGGSTDIPRSKRRKRSVGSRALGSMYSKGASSPPPTSWSARISRMFYSTHSTDDPASHNSDRFHTNTNNDVSSDRAQDQTKTHSNVSRLWRYITGSA